MPAPEVSPAPGSGAGVCRFRRRPVVVVTLLAAWFPPRRDPFDDWGWHVSGRDWPAEPCGLGVGEVLAAVGGITPEHAQAATTSLLRAGGGS